MKNELRRSRFLSQNGGRCIYTGRPATSADHVPAKCFLAQPLPANLATVPCDGEFNSSIARDEQYFLMLLGQVVIHPAIARRVHEGGDIDRALVRSPGLDQRLINQLQVTGDGRVAIMPETERIDRVLRKLAAGVYYVRFEKAPGIDHFASLGLHSFDEPGDIAIKLSWSQKPLEWTYIVQWSIFSYGFAEDSEYGLLCNLCFYNALFGIVKCPPLQAE